MKIMVITFFILVIYQFYDFLFNHIFIFSLDYVTNEIELDIDTNFNNNGK
jgi:hypothetical protein